jgi:hypothetical protein
MDFCTSAAGQSGCSIAAKRLLRPDRPVPPIRAGARGNRVQRAADVLIGIVILP